EDGVSRAGLITAKPARRQLAVAERMVVYTMQRISSEKARNGVKRSQARCQTSSLSPNVPVPDAVRGPCRSAGTLLVIEGDDRSRTGVRGFAGRCLTTRPRRPGG